MKMKITKDQAKIIVENDKLVKKFVQKTFPKESYENKQDLISDGMLILCERINTFDETKAKYSTWVYTMLGFYLRNVHNKKRHHTAKFFLKISDDNGDGNKNPQFNKKELETNVQPYNLTELEQIMEHKYLDDYLKQLSDEERIILTMYYNDYSVEDISKKTGMKKASIYHRKIKAIDKLRKLMK